MTDTVRRKLIEVALPLEAINRESAREKSIRHGHPSTMHPWWARRPLAACRAVLFAQLVDDPSARPDEFPTQEAQDAERERLFLLIERLVPWEATTDDEILAEAHAEILKSCAGVLPRILDPFAGGGSIPLEAQRLGLEAHASDLNPVAVLLTKALIELPAPFTGRPPVNPTTRDSRFDGAWTGAEGLAEDVRHYGRWMRNEAERRLGHLYPQAELPGGGTATVIAWIWTRTVVCPNPACRARMPLVRSFWLGRKKGKEAYVIPVIEGTQVRFEIGHDPAGPAVVGTVGRTGAQCLCCATSVPLAHVRAEGRAGRMGAQLMAIAAKGHRQRVYLPPTPRHEAAADVPIPPDVPDTRLPENPRAFTTPNYGLTRHADLFTARQLTLLTTLSDLVQEARQRVLIDAKDESGYGEGYADSVAAYLALTVSRLSDRHSAQTTWDSSTTKEGLRGTFARQAIPMQWDYAESDPFNASSGNLEEGLNFVSAALTRAPCGPGRATQFDAQRDGWTDLVISTDPPYYDNVGYADLSDYFYVWLRRSIGGIFPDLFLTLLTPKAEELVADPYRHGGADGARRHFEQGFVDTFKAAVRGIPDGFPLTLFYAFKQSEDVNGSTVSTGWETMLEGMLSAGFAITGTWPVRTELGNRVRSMDSNALASSIVLACRRRSETAVVIDRRGFVSALSSSLPAALRLLQQGNIAPVDLAQAAIGPGMAIFSSYAKVLEPDGSPMTVRTALGLINRALDEVLAEHEGEFDGATRWAVRWFQEHGYDDGAYGKAETLSTALAVSVGRLERDGLVRARGGKVHLLEPIDLPDRWQPNGSLTAWEVVHHLMKRLSAGGERAASALLAEVGGLSDPARDLAYRLYSVSDRRGWSASATAFNGLVTSWPDIARMAREQTEGARRAGDQLTLA